MDKETLSNYGWIVVLVLVLAVMLALASPFGTFVAGAIKSTTAGLFGVNQNALDAAGINIGDVVFSDCEHLETEIRNVTADYSGDTCCKECGKILGTGTYTILEGGKYTAADGTVYNPGDSFPETVTTGDKYQYGNYEYRYNEDYGERSGGWIIDETINGWGVRCIKNIADPGPMLESINENPIVSLHGTFRRCTALTIVPEIPKTVHDLSYTFHECSSLKTYVGSTDADGDFSKYIIPESVVCMYGTFYSCPTLTVPPVIPQYVTDMRNTFSMCSNLSEFCNIPNGVTNMRMTFFYCSSLTDATGVVIPASVTDIADCFQYCTSLTGTMKIDCNPEIYTYCFQAVNFKTQNLTLAGDSTMLDAIGSSSNSSYCRTCNGHCNGNH